MTGLVPLLVPATVPGGRPMRSAALLASGRPLPVPALLGRRVRATVYAIVAVDHRGRVADRAVFRALGWTDTTRFDLRADAGRVLVTAAPEGRHRLACRDRLLLPAHLRRGCGIEPGDRVLLAAEPADGVVAVYALARLDAMLDALVGPVLGSGVA